jgi:hypothetical protein
MTSEPDFNAHIPGAPRAGCTAADRGQALWDVMTVLAGRRALGSVHADETRGGMEEILDIQALTDEVVAGIRDSEGCWEIETLFVEHEDALGKRRDFFVFNRNKVSNRLRRHGFYPKDTFFSDVVEPFLCRSLTEIFPLGSPERNAIDEMYGEDSQSQWRKITEKESQ